MTARIAYYNALPGDPFYATDPFDPSAPGNLFPDALASELASVAASQANAVAVAAAKAAADAGGFGKLTWGAALPAGAVNYAGSSSAPDAAPSWQPDWALDPNSEFNKPAQFQVQTNLDDWFRAHNGGARYTVFNGVTIDNATQAYLDVKRHVAAGDLSAAGTGINADLDAEAAGAVAKGSVVYKGGWTPATDPNATPVHITATDPFYIDAPPVPPSFDPTAPPVSYGYPLTPAGAVPMATATQATPAPSRAVWAVVVVVVALLAWHFRRGFG